VKVLTNEQAVLILEEQFMRRVFLLALLALALPTVALADSMDFSTGTFVSGSTSGTLTTSVSTTITGSLNTITVSTGSLTLGSCPTGLSGTCYDFSGGSVTVKSGSTTVFTDSLSGGLLNKNGSSLGILAGLAPDSTVASGAGTVSLALKNGKISTGSIDVSLVTTPEPGTLGLIGTGLIGLAGIARRKLRP
jgi:PEP-CTERM motif